MGWLKNNSRVANIHGEQNKIQIAHVMFRDSESGTHPSAASLNLIKFEFKGWVRK
jgi:hypothetical protein